MDIQYPAREAHAHDKQAERHVVCALLHAASLYGLLAMIASGVVWASQRARCRFVAFQARQAFLFQLVVFLDLPINVVLLAAGFWFVLSGGPVEGGEPEGISLMAAGAAGLVTMLFSRAALSLWGVWAGVRLLRGHSFRYPILGGLALRWAAALPAVMEGESEDPPMSSGEPVLAALVHLVVLNGLSVILAPVLWATARRRSTFLTNHLFQASFFQLLMTGLIYVWQIIHVLIVLFLSLSGDSSAGPLAGIVRLATTPAYFLAATGVTGLLFFTMGILGLIAAIYALMGRDFRYPITGRWLDRYLDRE